MGEWLSIWAIGIVGLSGAAGLLPRRWAGLGQWITTIVAALGALAGLAGVGVFWARGAAEPVALPWEIPGGEALVGIDGISAVFLVPVWLVSLLGGVYGLAYWKQSEHADSGCRLRTFYGTLTAGMALLLIARNSVLFLFGWEIMALSAFFLVTTEDRREDVREAGWFYVVATHTATLCLFALFGLLRAAGGSYALVPLENGVLTPGASTAIFVCALVGFGLKAGIMPLHVWLPPSHATAPSHVSAIMSGVILKMGIYGLVRVLSLVPDPPIAWGYVVLGLGAVSGVLGVAFAIGQHDLKRLLAYHSVENVGIIVMGLGLALLGRSVRQPAWVALGLAAALLHVWNHALFKSLLFFSAGSVAHATGTRAIDRLGGLAKTMPRTALCFLVGAIAICGLPPLNGFVSEWFLYVGLFGALGLGEGPSCPMAAFAAVALAFIGALALACFVKAFGAVFLGTARSSQALAAHESSWSMVGPMAVLAVLCAAIGLLPTYVTPALDAAVAVWQPDAADAPARLTDLAPVGWIGGMGAALLAATCAVRLVLEWRMRAGGVVPGPTWGCGFVAPTARMQYTASSFARMLVDFFAWALRPREKRPSLTQPFPPCAEFHSDVPDTVLDGAVRPAFRAAAEALSWFRVFHQGSVQTYLFYIFVTLLALLLWR